jgi:hypothetical protein
VHRRRSPKVRDGQVQRKKDLWWTRPDWSWIADNRMLLDRIGVEITKCEVRWTESQARASRPGRSATPPVESHTPRPTPCGSSTMFGPPTFSRFGI